MKIIWTADDIICGRIICKAEHEFSNRKNILERQFKPNGWTSKWTYKIGYSFGGKEKEKFHLLSMTDGLVGSIKTAEEMAKYLNKEKMIPMPYKWLMATMEYLRELNESGNC